MDELTKQALATLWDVVRWGVPALLGLICVRYVQLLGEGGKPEGSLERAAYQDLRARLLAGGTPARAYGAMLTAFLNGVDRFFGDVDDLKGRPAATRSAFPRAFGLQTPAPLWTGSAYDRCLTIALFYPIVTILLIWAVSGHVGSAEQALGLSEAEPWWRALAVGGLLAAMFGLLRSSRTDGRKSFAWLSAACAGVFAFSGALAGTGASVFALVLAFAGAFLFALTVAVAFSIAFAFNYTGAGAFAVSFAVAYAPLISDAPLFAVAVALAVPLLNATAFRFERQGIFLFFLTVALTAVAYTTAAHAGLIPEVSWQRAAPILLVLGLLTLINAPFDWLSLGLTRGLLRRGVELGGWWPYALALIDLVAALLLLALMAGAMVVGVQGFDYLAGLQGRAPTLGAGVPDLLAAVAENPAAPEYWWIYATLFSTLIPCVFNLVMGAWSLTRGLPLLSRAMGRAMPEDRDMPIHNRAGVAALLTGQWAVGAALALGGLGLAGYGLWRAFPDIGVWFLDYARFIAGLELPRQINDWALALLSRAGGG